MKCKKCKKEILDESVFCMFCGSAQTQKKKKMYQRPDGLFERSLIINGKRVAFRGKTESEINKKILHYTETEKNGRTFGAVAEDWEASHFANLAYNSTKNYKPAYQRAYDFFKDTFIKEITANHVNSFIAKFASKGYAQKTVRTQLLVLNLIFTKAVVDGDIEHNPAEYVRIPKNLSKTKRNMPEDNELEIVKSSLDKTFGFFAYFLLYTGCRRGEALALQFKDIDFDKREIYITKSVYYDNNAPKIKTPKTEAGHRVIPLLDKLFTIFSKGKPNEYIFGWDDGALMTQSQFQRSWDAYKKETGLSITPHQLRHAFATILFEAGIEEKDAQELLGHSSIAMTKDIYTHIRSNRKETTAKQLNLHLE